MSANNVIIAGATPVHLLVYPSSDADSPSRDQQSFGVHRCNTGAALVADLLHASAEEHKHQVQGPALEVLKDGSLEQSTAAITELEVAEQVADQLVFRVKRSQPLVTKPVWQAPRGPVRTADGVSVLILQDTESEFSNPNDAVDLFRSSRPGVLIYHMARPLGTGVIWDAVRRGPFVTKDIQDPEKLIVVIDADDLRAEGIELAYGLSWEKTCEDFVGKLGSNGQLDTLATCAHLLVLFGCDGIIYHRGREMEEPILFFDPLGVEGRFTRRHIGPLPGVVEAFIGGLATKVAQKSPGWPLNEGIDFGFIVARRLAQLGLRETTLSKRPRYPFPEIMKKAILPNEAPITLEIPSESISRGEKRHWSILHHNIGDPVQVACHIVTKGPYSAANWVPVAQFGRLLVLDRSEIESFRTIFNAIHEYLSAPHIKPLNIGIFGSRGSGKYFAARQVAEAAAAAASSTRKIQHLRFNLSQFTNPEDLSVAFNKVRECNLSGALPLVYVNDFDTELSGQQLGWLAHLLPPMHSGRIHYRGDLQHIGPAIILLGSRFGKKLTDFEHFFTNPEDDTPLPRAEEFLSCLHAFVDVIGLDQVDDSDVLYPVRRAVVLRGLLEEREPMLKMGDGISIDQSVLDGLLLIPKFRHGLRSLRSIITLSKVTGKAHFERAALPPETQLGLHLNYPTFLECSMYNIISDELREYISERLHGAYLRIRKEMPMTVEEKQDLEKDPAMEPWESLKEELRESTRAHAVDIPRKLRMISCFLAENHSPREAVLSFRNEELDMLGEKEHERWNAERLQNQWHAGKRDPEKRTSPFLKPWRDLEPKWQNVDRDLVKSYPTILPENYKIYRIGKVEKTKLTEPTSGVKRSTTGP